jgi:hypothetical protein
MLLTIGLISSLSVAYDKPGGAWLESKKQWNMPGGSLPRWNEGQVERICTEFLREPETANEKVVGKSGWRFHKKWVGSVKGNVELVQAFGFFDTQCRLMQTRGLVFLRRTFVGTISPGAMDARWDGEVQLAAVLESGEIVASFDRYKDEDPMCCPSRESVATCPGARPTRSSARRC